MKYTDLLKMTIKLYNEGKYIVAYQFLTESASKVTDHDAHIYMLRFCIASMAGLTDQALQIMKEAIIDKGYWYSYDYLYAEEDLLSIRDHSDFKEMAKVCKERELAAKELTESELVIITPKEYSQQKKYPLMMILHGNGQNNRIAREDWLVSVQSDYILAFPQSSQVQFSDSYVWNDYIKGCREVKGHFNRVFTEYSVHREDVIIGGFSAGTRTALYSVLNDSVNVKGLILNGCWLPELDEWKPLFDKLKNKRIKSYITCGDQDEISLESTKKLVNILKEKGIDYKYRLIKDMGHDFPENFNEYMREAIEFIK
ncbi:hypothetical protein I5677_10775 [Mobilitalea sibirica]|uniref:Phospholipase/carboxylesterase/thioesterase domain-containing protein n=1 Tax=Mobilitalea sibirica TaxID=1462919 RepID=A0A8J7KTH0_9FIRM|nr:hypothetical protein [Mobilitalea sibirica]MBH1941376.1 hypothetical protein [Mobilitalea sibirica]